MYLHDMLCGFLWVINFDVRFVVSYFFKTIHILLICANCSGLTLIDIIACYVLSIA